MEGLRARHGIVIAVIVTAVAGIVVDVTSPGVRDWFYFHSLTTSTLVGVLMIAATYLVVERALGEREQARWSEAAGPLLEAIATAGAATDAELRAAARGEDAGDLKGCEWLGELLARYQAALSATPELVIRWHAALSLVQHARATHARRPVIVDLEYEAAWDRFRATFAGVCDLDAHAADARTTWVLPALSPSGGRATRVDEGDGG